jgi:hypothetical protein
VREGRARAVAVALVASVGCGALALVSAPACTTHQCDLPDRADDYFKTGRLIDENTWESNAIDDTWLTFDGQHTLVFHIPDFFGRDVVSVEPYLSVSATPNDPNNLTNFVPASGNPVQFIGVGDETFCFLDGKHDSYKHIGLMNNTCAPYFLRLVVRVAPAAPFDGGGPLRFEPEPPTCAIFVGADGGLIQPQSLTRSELK